MLTRPDEINNVDYWAYRLNEADKAGQLQYSVYLTNATGWEKIWQVHKEIITKVIPENAKILDAGCAFGRLSQLFSKENYIGVDFVPHFINRAKDMFPDKIFLVGDLVNLPFKDKEFDWAICISIRKMVQGKSSPEHWNKMEKELNRVSKKILILEYTSPEIYEIL